MQIPLWREHVTPRKHPDPLGQCTLSGPGPGGDGQWDVDYFGLNVEYIQYPRCQSDSHGQGRTINGANNGIHRGRRVQVSDRLKIRSSSKGRTFCGRYISIRTTLPRGRSRVLDRISIFANYC
jgi:hypothetical protein